MKDNFAKRCHQYAVISLVCLGLMVLFNTVFKFFIDTESNLPLHELVSFLITLSVVSLAAAWYYGLRDAISHRRLSKGLTLCLVSTLLIFTRVAFL